MSNPGHSSDRGSELGGNTNTTSTYYPPPPPGPPPAQSYNSDQTKPLSQSLPLQQQQHEQPYQQSVPQHAPQHEQQYNQVNQTQQHHSQPPHLGPQPHLGQQQQQQQPYFPPPPAQHDEKQSHLHHDQQQSQGSCSIPAYNPANPVFAPPPTSAAASGVNQSQSTAPVSGQTTTSQQMGDHLSQPTPQQQQQQQQQQHTDANHGQKRSSWGGRFKSMLSSGAAAPINSLAHKLGSQSFLPETLDKECDKAASILKSFCVKGVYADPDAGQPPTSIDPKAKESSSGLIDPTKEKPKNRVIVTIPPKVISKAVGLAIFTTLRAGFQVSGATGSGVLIARLPDGSWSPPSGIQVHSLGGGFQIGLDIYDCVCVINSKEALAAFMNTRVSLGSDLAVVAGPYGAGGAVDFGTAVQRGRDEADKKTTATGDIAVTPAQPQTTTSTTTGTQALDGQHSGTLKPGKEDPKRRSLSASGLKPVFSYVKSRGFYAGIQVDGTVVVERKDANAAFYGSPVTVQQILQGQVPSQGPQNMWPTGARGLIDTLKGAEAGVLTDHVHPQQTPVSQQTTVSGQTPGPQPTPVTMSGAMPHSNVPAGQTAPSNAAQGNAVPGHIAPEHAAPGYNVPGQSAPAEGLSEAPPGYVDDGRHAHVGDVKYA